MDWSCHDAVAPTDITYVLTTFGHTLDFSVANIFLGTPGIVFHLVLHAVGYKYRDLLLGRGSYVEVQTWRLSSGQPWRYLQKWSLQRPPQAGMGRIFNCLARERYRVSSWKVSFLLRC